MAEQQPKRIPEGTTFRDAEGNLKVFREGEFHDTDELAIQTGPVEAGLVAAGETASNILTGAGQFLGIDDAALQDAGLAQDPALTETLRAEQPVATFVGDAAPFVAGGVATGGAGLPAVLATEAALGAVEAQGGGRDPLTGAAFGAAGGAGGFGLGKMAQRLAQSRAARQGGGQGQAATEIADELAPARATRAERQASAFEEAPTRLDEAQAPQGSAAGAQRTSHHANMVRLADDTGITLTTGERVNSDTMRQIESGFRSQPGGPPRGKEIVRENQETLNRSWSRAMGAGDEVKITPEVMDQARRNAAAEYNAAAEAAGTVDVRGVPRIVRETREGRGTSLIQDEQVQEALASLDAFENVEGGMAARDFMATRAELNTKMRNAAQKGDGLLQQTLSDVINAMDEAFEGSAGPQAAALYKQAREHQRFILTLERGKGVNLDQGNVNPTTAGTSLRKTFKQEAGRGDPGDLSDAGIDAIETTRASNYFKDIVGDSGTATRLAVQELISNPAKLLQMGVQRGVGEVFDRAVSPAVQAVAGGVPKAGTQTGGLLSDLAAPGRGPLPLDIGGPSVPGGPLDL